MRLASIKQVELGDNDRAYFKKLDALRAWGIECCV
jgi:hypothetical protein